MYNSAERCQCGFDSNQKTGRKQRLGVFKKTQGILSSQTPSCGSVFTCCLAWSPYLLPQQLSSERVVLE